VKYAISTLLLVAAAFLSAPAQATPILWTISGVIFPQGGKVSGTFDYDALTSTYSNIDITTTTDTRFTGETYTASFFTNSSNLDVTNGAQGLALTFGNPLPNAGGSDPIVQTAEGTCFSSGCAGGTFLVARFVTFSGVATGTPAVPEPASAAVFGTGLLGLLLIRRRAGQSDRP
jgi:hypothetical protein